MRNFEDAELGYGTLGSGLVREQVGVSAAPGVLGYLRPGETKNEDGILGWGGVGPGEEAYRNLSCKSEGGAVWNYALSPAQRVMLTFNSCWHALYTRQSEEPVA